MIWRIRERSAFDRLSAEGRRVRSGVLWCSHIPDPTATPPRVAFAVGRAYGPAVARNRVRRRLRVVLATCDLAPGWYLFGVRRGSSSDGTPSPEPTSTELMFDLHRVIARLANPAPDR